jgi:hypothetical protein
MVQSVGDHHVPGGVSRQSLELDFSHLAAWQTASLKGAMGTP